MGKVKEIVKDNWSAKIPDYIKVDESMSSYRDLDHTDILKPIPKDFLDGVRVKFDHYGENDYVVKVRDNAFINLDIGSWQGISVGAVHFYGKIKIYGIDITDYDKPTGSHGGYLGAPEEEMPLAMRLANGGLEFTITRPIEQRDIDHDAGERYRSYRLGEPTRGWWSEQELIKEGKRIAKEFFPDWKFKINV